MPGIHRDDLLPQAPSRSALTKREFLKGAGMAAAALGFGELHAAAADRPGHLIVVGGGNAGLPAALFAAQRGIDDSPQQHCDDIMRISRNTADPVLLRLAVEHAAPMFDWLTDHGFVPLDGQPITGTTHEPYSRPRYAWAKEGGRAILQILMTQLQPFIDSGQVGVLSATRVIELIQRADRSVTGIVTRTEAGQVGRHDARNVALTCGGYTDNSGMYAPCEQTPDYCRNTWPYSQGAGIDPAGLAATVTT